MTDDDDETRGLFSALGVDPSREIEDVTEDFKNLLKNPEVVGHLAQQGINASLALLALEGLGAYLLGDKAQAADDLRTVAEEIEGRLRFGNDPPLA